MTTDAPLFRIRGLRKTRSQGPGYALGIPALDVAQGERLAIVGDSGCGKSTALDLLGMTLRPDRADSFRFAPGDDATDVMALWRDGRLDSLASLRMRHIGYVLQTGGLLPFLNIRENIELPVRALGRRGADIDGLARRLGIARLLGSPPGRLSVGERQRVAIARALASRPRLILADEPTAALDPVHAETTMRMFLEVVAESGATLILVTHSEEMVRLSGARVLRIRLHSGPGEAIEGILEEDPSCAA